MATRTEATVVAVFRNTSDAQAAAEELQSSGFSQDEIYMNYADPATSSARGEGSSHHEGGIAGWFKRIFGSDDEGDRHY